MLTVRRTSVAAVLAASVVTLVPTGGALSGEEPTVGCAGLEEAAGGEGACAIEYVYVEPGDRVDFTVPSPYDGSVRVSLAVGPSAGRVTQLAGREWRYDATGVSPSHHYLWFDVCASSCSEVKVVVKVKDLSAPETTIVEGPASPTLATDASFAVRSSEDGGWFKCSLDHAAWDVCGSPLRYEGLAPGEHVLKVKAVDAQGNYDATPAVWTWVIGDGRFADDESSVHEANIEKLAASRITRGCNADGTMFCPGAPVTRGQMAAFIDRAIGLPDTSEDFFADDEESIFEDSINRLAAAGLTNGCGDGTNYCADRLVTRGQLAAFIDRVLELPDGPDVFADDEDSPFEHNINALAAAGITRGCGDGSSYCPTKSVTRGQFATLFVKAGFTD